MKFADVWITGLMGLGLFMWIVFNGKEVNTLIGGLAKNSVGLVTGIATVAPGATPSYYGQ
jgi:hypothetical protein